MKLHLYFCFSFLAQKPLGKWCNALRLLHPTSLRQFAGVGWLGTMSCQSNKRGVICTPIFLISSLYIAARLSGWI